MLAKVHLPKFSTSTQVNSKLEIRHMIGQLVHAELLTGPNQYDLQKGNLESGLFYIRLFDSATGNWSIPAKVIAQ